MYNLVSCYDSLEMKVRGDVLSDKVYLSDTDMNMDMDTDGLKLSQSESILTDMTHVISPMYEHSCTMGGKSPILSIGSTGRGFVKQNGINGYKHDGKSRHVSYEVPEPEFRKPKTVANTFGEQWSDAHDGQVPKEVEPEPYCFPVFRWTLIIVGLAMLVCVLVVMAQLLVDWGRGTA